MRTLLIFSLACLAVSTAWAGPSREEMMAHIMRTMDMRGQVEAYARELIRQPLGDPHSTEAAELDGKIKAIIVEEVDKAAQDVIEDYLVEVEQIISDNLSDEEVTGLYEFFLTDAGRSFGGKLKIIERDLYEVDARYLELLAERAQAGIKKRLTEAGYE